MSLHLSCCNDVRETNKEAKPFLWPCVLTMTHLDPLEAWSISHSGTREERKGAGLLSNGVLQASQEDFSLTQWPVSEPAEHRVRSSVEQTTRTLVRMTGSQGQPLESLSLQSVPQPWNDEDGLMFQNPLQSGLESGHRSCCKALGHCLVDGFLGPEASAWYPGLLVPEPGWQPFLLISLCQCWDRAWPGLGS